jgi:hypothetical protein
MLRRVGLGVLALIALGLVTSRPAAAQDQGMGMDMSGSSGSGASMSGMSMGTSDSSGSGASMAGMNMGGSPCGCSGMSTPGMGMMGMGMGMPGMGMMGLGMHGMGTMGMGMSGSGTYQGPGAGWTSVYITAIHHPGDQIVPGTMCTGCSALYDSCVWGGQCTYMEAGLWPDGLGLHPTTNQADVTRYWPQGPMSCMSGRAGNPATCVDAPGEWNLRAGMPGMDSGAGGMSR